MRLIGTLKTLQQAEHFVRFLAKEGLAAQQEELVHDDTSPEYIIWVMEEKDVAKSKEWFEIYSKDPEDPRFLMSAVLETGQQFFSQSLLNDDVKKPLQDKEKSKTLIRKQLPNGKLNFVLILISIFLYVWGNLALSVETEGQGKFTPNVDTTISVYQKLLFDYPKKQELLDKLYTLYGEQLKNPQLLPVAGQKAYEQYKQTPQWQGLYYQLINYINDRGPLFKFTEPMFEKIRQGEFWRFFTPTFLHGGIFHLFFNIIWMILLGNQLENRLGLFRYGGLIAATSLITNIAQYLAGGPYFLGLSGVICALIAFMWIRQKKAPWEGYQLQKGTVIFISVFVLGLAVLQLFSLTIEVTFGSAIALPIANTAHIVGGISGIILAQLPFFRAKF